MDWHSNGLSRYNKELDNFINYTHLANNSTTLSDNIIWDIYQDNAGILWVSTESGLQKYNPESDDFY